MNNLKYTKKNFEILYKTLQAIEASVIVNGDMSVSFAIDGKLRQLMVNAIAKAEGR
jgi:hypothetical protein